MTTDTPPIRYDLASGEDVRCPSCGGIFTQVVPNALFGSVTLECGHPVKVVRYGHDPCAIYVSATTDVGLVALAAEEILAATTLPPMECHVVARHPGHAVITCPWCAGQITVPYALNTPEQVETMLTDHANTCPARPTEDDQP